MPAKPDNEIVVPHPVAPDSPELQALLQSGSPDEAQRNPGLYLKQAPRIPALRAFIRATAWVTMRHAGKA
jgi:hypothetical protein